MMVRHTFGKAERLKSRKSIDALFKEGQRFNMGSIRVLYRKVAQPGIRVGVGVSARQFKIAVERNRVKRLLRESYRLQKQILASVVEHCKGVDIFFIYTAPDMPVYSALAPQVEKILTKLNTILAKESE
ncbi:MAG: ribonuclease protein component [Bacteroidota bacterium]|jgi:ribonuclease P protein component